MDPGNSLYWRANLRRLEVESFRDAVLQISGQLDLSPPAEGSLLAKTFLGKEYGSASSDRVNFDKEIAAYRHRTLYLPIVRNELPEILKQFDFADNNAPTGARDARTIPSQALFLMNDAFIETQSVAAANRLVSQKLGDKDAVDLATRWTNGTVLSEAMRREVIAYLDNRRSELVGEGKSPAETETEAWTDLFQTLFSGVEFRYLK